MNRRAAALLVATSAVACRRAPTRPAPAAPADAATPPAVVAASAEPPLPPVAMPELLPVPDGHGMALPQGCTAAGRTLRAHLGSPAVRFVLGGGAPGQLAVLEADDAGAATAGALLGLVGQVPPRALPHLGAAPLLGAAAGRWAALLDRPLDPPARELVLWREPARWERLATGDTLVATDLRCEADRCAALASRAATVAGGGASVWTGLASAPASEWKRVDLASPLVPESAHPLAVAGLVGDRVDVALLAGDEIIVASVGPSPAAVVARVAPGGEPLDVATLPGSPPRVVLAMHDRPVGPDGCVDGAPGIRLVRPGAEPLVVPVTAPPRATLVRPLAKGALLAWIAPVSCRIPWRSIVHAVRLDETGAPVGEPTALDDATGFALATRGAEVEIVLRTPDEVRWQRASCP